MANVNDNVQSSASQCAMIKEYLENGNTLTQLQALNLFGCFRLASRIHDLRNRGMNILKQRVLTPSGKWVAEYSLIS